MMTEVPLTISPTPKVRRTGKPKVKSGCITCKKRRVKCDETKPYCLRCQNFGCPCDGYEFPSRGSIQRSLPKRPLIAKDGVDLEKANLHLVSQGICYEQALLEKYNDAGSASLVTSEKGIKRIRLAPALLLYDHIRPHAALSHNVSSDELLRYSPSINLFESEEDRNYFRFYCDITSKQLSGGYDPLTWRLLFLQSCHNEPFVRHAILGIGALSKAMEAIQLEKKKIKGLPGINEQCPENPHYKYAIQQYAKAVRLMRNAVSEGEENIRTALISCLLTVCFESFLGHHENALSQTAMGLRLMQDWFNKQPHKELTCGLHSPSPDVIEDGLFHTFVRLDIGQMHFFDDRPIEVHRTMSLRGTETMRFMPCSFSHLDQAGLYFSVVMSRIMHFVKWVEANTLGRGHRLQKQTLLGETDMETKFPNQWSRDSIAILFEVDGYIAELRIWRAAFQPIWEYTKTPAGQIQLLPATLVYVHSILMKLLLFGLNCSEESLWDQYIPDFKEIVTLCEVLLKHPDLTHSVGRAVFVFDQNVITPLLIVALKCREGVLRRRAIELLTLNPRREGTWDSTLAAGIGLWTMTVEEQGLKLGEHVPEQNRVRLAACKQDFQLRTAHLTCSQNVDGKTIYHETNITW